MAPSGSKILGNATIWNKDNKDNEVGNQGEGFALTSKIYPIEVADNYLATPGLTATEVDIEQVIFPPKEATADAGMLGVPGMQIQAVSIMGPIEVTSFLDVPGFDLYSVEIKGPIEAVDNWIAEPGFEVIDLKYSVGISTYLEGNEEDLEPPDLTVNEVIIQ